MNNEKQTIRYFSMFTGVGGFELGLKGSNDCSIARKRKTERELSTERENIIRQRNSQSSSSSRKSNAIYQCVGVSEIDKYANQLLANKFPDIKNYGDATKIIPSELPNFDMLCGGFPCQTFSIAGKRRGFEDTRGTMFFEVARILEVKRPKFVLLENVKGLLNHNKGETFSVIIQTLEELGYRTQWVVLNSKFFGVPQNRERVFIIGSLRGESRPEILPLRQTDTETNQEGIVHPTLTEAIGRPGCSKEYIKSCQTILDINQAQRVYSTEGTSITIKGLGGGQGAKTGLYAVHSLYPRSSKTNQGGTGHLMKQPTESYCVDTGNMQVVSMYDDYNSKMRSDNIAGTLTQNVGSKSERNGQKVVIPVLTPDREEKRQNGRRFKEDGEPSFILTQQDKHGVFDGMQIRRLTPTECERLQGFPDGWTEGFSDTQRYKMMGNAVTVNVIQTIGEKLSVV